MATNPYQKQETPAPATTEEKKGWRGGRPEPEAATAKMIAARNHRAKFAGERNELLAWLARLYPSYLMPVAGTLGRLTDQGTPGKRGRRALCIEHPVAGKLYWLLSEEEVATVGTYGTNEVPYFAKLTGADNDWERTNTQKQRSERIAYIVATTTARAASPPKAKRTRVPNPKRLTPARARASVRAKKKRR